MLLVATGALLFLANASVLLCVQRRYTHSILWRRTIGRLQARHPSLLVWQPNDPLIRTLNLLGLTLGLILLIAGLALSP